MPSLIIKDVLARDVRFPTSLKKDGSDAVHPDPDYSMVYVQIIVSRDNKQQIKEDNQKDSDNGDGSSKLPIGCGLTFTLGRGNELVLHAVDSLRFLVVGKDVKSIQGIVEKLACTVHYFLFIKY